MVTKGIFEGTEFNGTLSNDRIINNDTTGQSYPAENCTPIKKKQYTGRTNDLPRYWRFRETPGHGYLHIPAEAQKNVPAIFRESSYEEDCAYAIPILFNAELFTPETVKEAEQTIKDWFPAQYEKHFNVELKEGESSLKDQYYYDRVNNLGNYESFVGYGDWCYDVPEGYVYRGVKKVTMPNKEYKISSQEGEEIYVLIKNEKDAGRYFTEDQIQRYNRDEKYYTWEAFTAATGQQRYK